MLYALVIAYVCSYRNNVSLITEFVQHLNSVTSEEEFLLRVRRSNVLLDTLVGISRSTYSPYKSLVVCRSVYKLKIMVVDIVAWVCQNFSTKISCYVNVNSLSMKFFPTTGNIPKIHSAKTLQHYTRYKLYT